MLPLPQSGSAGAIEDVCTPVEDEADVCRSIQQFREQPSPSNRLPSSHCSTPARIPSPQSVEHMLGISTQVHPSSRWQNALHPSPARTFWSSHSSGGLITPFPQSALIGKDTCDDAAEEEDGDT